MADSKRAAVAASDHDAAGAAPPVWQRLRFEAGVAAEEEAALSGYLRATILDHGSLAQSLSYHLAQKLDGPDMKALQIREVCKQVFQESPSVMPCVERDMQVVLERDPATRTLLQPFLFSKGFLALETYRVANWLWKQGRDVLALFFQSRISEIYQVDIHPAAKMGCGIFLDHATGLVIGETASVGDDCSFLHGVTLGGTGKDFGDRHPKIGEGVLIGAGASILGPIHVGDEARIGASSVVLQDVPARCTAAGVPAKIVGGECPMPARSMDHQIKVD